VAVIALHRGPQPLYDAFALIQDCLPQSKEASKLPADVETNSDVLLSRDASGWPGELELQADFAAAFKDAGPKIADDC
jgi:hypothetical protein